MVSKKKSTKSRSKTTDLKDIKRSVISTASSITEDIDKVKDVVLRDLQEGFETVTKRAKTASRSAAKVTAEVTSSLAETASSAGESVKESIAEAHLAETFRKLIDDVEVAAEEIKEGINVRFNQLREAAAKKIQPTTTPAKKKPAAKKKAGVKKKSTIKKKAAVKKKIVPKKAPLKKKASAKKTVKKAATRKSQPGRAAAKKQSIAKKTAAKK